MPAVIVSQVVLDTVRRFVGIVRTLWPYAQRNRKWTWRSERAECAATEVRSIAVTLIWRPHAARRSETTAASRALAAAPRSAR